MSEHPPPGWYADPEDQNRWRWWDGTTWAEQQPPPSQSTSGTSTTAKVLLSIVALFGILTFIGGLGDSDDEPAGDTVSDRDRYITFLRDEIPGASDRTDQQLVDGGRQVCFLLDDGMTRDELATATIISGFDVQETASLLVAAVNTYCPEHRDVIE